MLKISTPEPAVHYFELVNMLVVEMRKILTETGA